MCVCVCVRVCVGVSYVSCIPMRRVCVRRCQSERSTAQRSIELALTTVFAVPSVSGCATACASLLPPCLSVYHPSLFLPSAGEGAGSGRLRAGDAQGSVHVVDPLRVPLVAASG